MEVIAKSVVDKDNLVTIADCVKKMIKNAATGKGLYLGVKTVEAGTETVQLTKEDTYVFLKDTPGLITLPDVTDADLGLTIFIDTSLATGEIHFGWDMASNQSPLNIVQGSGVSGGIRGRMLAPNSLYRAVLLGSMEDTSLKKVVPTWSLIENGAPVTKF